MSAGFFLPERRKLRLQTSLRMASSRPPSRIQWAVYDGKHLPDEYEHPHLVEFLRSGGILEIGENRKSHSFARLRIRNRTLVVVKLVYRDFADVLNEMDSQARQFFERQEN